MLRNVDVNKNRVEVYWESIVNQYPLEILQLNSSPNELIYITEARFALRTDLYIFSCGEEKQTNKQTTKQTNKQTYWSQDY